MTLDQLKIGATGIIKSVGGEGALRRRLLDMGLTPKTKVTVRKTAPLGDPIELRLRSYELTIRKADAAKIEIFEGETVPAGWVWPGVRHTDAVELGHRELGQHHHGHHHGHEVHCPPQAEPNQTEKGE